MKQPTIVYPEDPIVRERLAFLLSEAVSDEDADGVFKYYKKSLKKNEKRIKNYLAKRKLD